MPSRKRLVRKASPPEIADPKAVLMAAEAAPRVFNVAEYFRSLYVMRAKGYSWRYLADWLKGFNIEVSHVHLHRLYVKEDLRLDRLTAKELQELGMPEEMIAERGAKNDPTKRLVAVDPEDEMSPEEYSEYQKMEWLKNSQS